MSGWNDFVLELLNNQGYPALFLVSFLASTILPLGSEWLLAALIISGKSPALSIAVALGGNTLGALTTYAIGIYGGPFLIGRVLRLDEASRARGEKVYARFGFWSLLLSWVPILGDPLCLLGGILRVHWARFTVLVAAGKLARYIIVGMVAMRV